MSQMTFVHDVLKKRWASAAARVSKRIPIAVLPTATKPLDTSNEQCSFVGHVDRYDYGGVYGWAADKRIINQAIEIEMVDGAGKRLGHVYADHFRQDLADLGFGNGYHGFYLPFSERSRSLATAFVCFADTQILLHGGVIHIQLEMLILSSPMSEGYISLMQAAARRVQRIADDSGVAF